MKKVMIGILVGIMSIGMIACRYNDSNISHVDIKDSTVAEGDKSSEKTIEDSVKDNQVAGAVDDDYGYDDEEGYYEDFGYLTGDDLADIWEKNATCSTSDMDRMMRFFIALEDYDLENTYFSEYYKSDIAVLVSTNLEEFTEEEVILAYNSFTHDRALGLDIDECVENITYILYGDNNP